MFIVLRKYIRALFKYCIVKVVCVNNEISHIKENISYRYNLVFHQFPSKISFNILLYTIYELIYHQGKLCKILCYTKKENSKLATNKVYKIMNKVFTVTVRDVPIGCCFSSTHTKFKLVHPAQTYTQQIDMATGYLYKICTQIHSKVAVTTAVITIPKIKAKNCFIDSFGSSSFKRSGNTVTKAMCRNVPAVNGKIHDVLASKYKIHVKPKNCKPGEDLPIELEAPLHAIAIKEPIRPPPAVKI